jgi:hypothetical protein
MIAGRRFGSWALRIAWATIFVLTGAPPTRLKSTNTCVDKGHIFSAWQLCTLLLLLRPLDISEISIVPPGVLTAAKPSQVLTGSYPN